jgi:thioredoxin-like negative regulator of GroEL
MKYLLEHEDFEKLIGRKQSDEPLPDLTIIWFSAEWCGPCKKIQINDLMNKFHANWLKCDIDRNDYTAGYCGIRSIPTFLVIYKTKILGFKTSADNNEINNWLVDIIP